MSLALIRGPIRCVQLRQSAVCLSCQRLKSSDGTTTPSSSSGGSSSSSSRGKLESKLAKYSDPEPTRRNPRGFLFSRLYDYVANYDKVLEKRFPKTIQTVRVFTVGAKDLFAEMKRFMKITRIANDSPTGLRALNRQEIELYVQLPKDLAKIAPVLAISALPFMNYVVFPLALMYPRTFLTRHFWTLQQRHEFQIYYLRQRLQYNRRVFRGLQSRLEQLGGVSESDHALMNHLLGTLGSGTHPTAVEIIAAKDIFARPPYQIKSLHYGHLKALCGLHGIHGGFFKRSRLEERSYLLHHMDLAIKREGDVHNMPVEAMRTSCILRGLNPTNLSNEEMIAWLQDWVQVSLQVNEANMSLYLHLPILLGYNHPNNWVLRYQQ